MSEKEKKTLISQEDVMKILDSCYEKCLNGIPKVSPSVEEMANDYLKKYKTKEEACKAMIRNQIATFFHQCHSSITVHGNISVFPKKFHCMTDTWLGYPEHGCNINGTYSAAFSG